MAHIRGIGGAFLYSDDPEALGRWYGERLGIPFEHNADERSSYAVFESLDPSDPGQKFETTFAIIPSKGPLPDGAQNFMLSFRVADLDDLLTKLAAFDITAKRQDYEYGRFAWIRDPAGHKVELFEPTSVA